MQATLTRLFELEDHPLHFSRLARPLPAPDGLRLAEISATTSQGEAVRGFWCRPDTGAAVPAVLVIHAHGGRYHIGADELMSGRPALAGPLGPALAALGIASLCLDLPCFGIRQTPGESARSKALLWQGKSLAGQMMGECRAALDWLSARPDVRADRIGVFGMSMGCTLGYWLAAVDTRVQALVQECCLADFGALIETGAHDLHGIYLTVPGLLAQASNGEIAAMIAPRAQFIGIGDLDPLTPPAAADIALRQVRAAYQQAGGQLVVHREPAAGHQETPEMRSAALAFLRQTLA
jgi:dienelactone hydrolase